MALQLLVHKRQHGGAGFNTLCRDYREAYDVDWRNEFAASLAKVRDERVDIFLGNHTGQNNAEEKWQQMKKGVPAPFVDRNAWRSFLTDLEERFSVTQKEERVGTDQRG